jgi:uncharacterized membrane protein YfhO
MTKNNRPVHSPEPSNDDSAFLGSLDKFLAGYGHYCLFAMIAFISIIVFRDFITLEKIYLFKDIGSDSININYPGFYSLADHVYKDGFPRWSFHQGMGQNIFPSFDPFSLYVILMGKNLVYYTVFYAELLKIFCAGLFFYLFLKRIIASDYVAILGAVLYSFSGFIILGGEWNVFSTQAVYVALLLYSFEKLYQDDNWILFPISIFLISANQPPDLYFIGLFLLIYITFRLFEAGDKEPKKISTLLMKVVLLGATGVAMSSFFLINIVQIILESPRGSGLATYHNILLSQPVLGFEAFYGPHHYLTALMRFFSCDILGTGSNFKGWNNYLEAPLFYCGLLSLVLLPHFLSISNRRKTIIYSILLFLFIFPVIFPFFRYAYWLFTGDYYRIFSFLAAVVILLIALKSMERIEGRSKTDIKITAATLFLLLFALYYPYKDEQIIDKNIRHIVTIFLIIYSVLIYLLQFKNIKNVIKIVLMSVIVVELVYFSNITINHRPVMSGEETVQKNGYNDYTVEAVKFIKSNDKTFFRITKDYYSSIAEKKGLNDAKVQDFYGTSSYHQFNQLNYIKFLQKLKIIDARDETNTRWIFGLDPFPTLHGFASIKYALTKAQHPSLPHDSYEPAAKFGNVTVYKNKFALPLGFTYEKYIPVRDFNVLTPEQRMFVLYKAAVIDDGAYPHFGNLTKLNLEEIPMNYSNQEYSEDIKALSRDALQISAHGQNKIKGKINITKDKMLFFSIPFDKGWNIEIDGKNVKTIMVNIGFIGVPVEKGLHDVELSFTPVYFYQSVVISLIAVAFFIWLIVFKTRRNKKLA